MLRLQHSRRQLVGRITRFDGHPLLRYYRAPVELFVDEVYRRAGFSGTACEYGLMYPMAIHAGTAELGQQGGVDIDHPAAKSRYHGSGHELQVPGEHDEVRIAERGKQLVGV